jgi:hypothetical protein
LASANDTRPTAAVATTSNQQRCNVSLVGLNLIASQYQRLLLVLHTTSHTTVGMHQQQALVGDIVTIVEL